MLITPIQSIHICLIQLDIFYTNNIEFFGSTLCWILLAHSFITVITVYRILAYFHLVITIPILLLHNIINEPLSHFLSIFNVSLPNPLLFALHVPTSLIFQELISLANNYEAQYILSKKGYLQSFVLLSISDFKIAFYTAFCVVGSFSMDDTISILALLYPWCMSRWYMK